MQVVAQPERSASALGSNRRELTALLAGCGVYQPDAVLFTITGRDRIRWLNGMVSNNIRDLASGHGVYAFVLNAQGHILGDLYVFNRGESLVAEIEREQAQSLMQVLKRYIIMDKVEIEELSGISAIGLAGPKAHNVLASAGLNANLSSLELSDVSWNGSRATLVRGDNPFRPNCEVWVPAENADSAREPLLRGGAEEVSAETLESFRILCGIPKVGRDIGEKTLPQETGQDRALNFNKGCYIGQEIVERIRARGSVHRTFIGFELDGPSSAPGTKIQCEGKDVGEITSVMAEPLHGKRLALGYLRKEYLDSDKSLVAGESGVKPVTLPFAPFE